MAKQAHNWARYFMASLCSMIFAFSCGMNIASAVWDEAHLKRYVLQALATGTLAVFFAISAAFTIAAGLFRDSTDVKSEHSS